ncbi:MAG: endonuclease/exonuclease/phosphatase family protein, partial [Candidatus Nanopelagicales bacterium]
ATTARPAPAANAVRVATYNVMKTSALKSRWPWGSRRVALANTVRAARPDVLLVQEANTQKWNGGTHIEDVRKVLSKVGYEIASRDYNRCTSWCTRGAHVFYNPARVAAVTPPSRRLGSAGMAGLSTIAGIGFGSIQDRAASWVFLRPVGSTRTTLYVSVHLPTDKTAAGERLRLAVAAKVRPWANSLIASSGFGRVDVVIGGDLNSYAKRQPNGAQKVLTDAGLVDGASAPQLVNGNYGTVNYTPSTRKYNGFPPRPYFYKKNTTRIDYVFASVAPLRHEVVLQLTKSGRFDNRFRASDHNMVLVDLPLR